MNGLNIADTDIANVSYQEDCEIIFDGPLVKIAIMPSVVNFKFMLVHVFIHSYEL